LPKTISLKNIIEIADKFGVNSEEIEMHGKYKAKLPLKDINKDKALNSNLILVSAISPTPAGEGKTTIYIGLSEGAHPAYEHIDINDDGEITGLF
jgi:formate--tetrahydrofolate ligase